MYGTVSATTIAVHMAVAEGKHPQVTGVSGVDTDQSGYALFTVVLVSGQRFRVTVEEVD